MVGHDRAGNVVGVDPHKRTLTAVVVDGRGGIVAGEHFRVLRWRAPRAAGVGAVVRGGGEARWGIENAAGWGRHTAIFPAGAGHDVRDVCPNRTARQDRGRQRGKSDTLDAERVARETLAHPLLSRAFKAACAQAALDEHRELLCLWHNQRRSLLKSRQHPLNEAEFLLCELPLELREWLPDTKAVRPRLAALAGRRATTAASTRSCTAWPSPSCAASPAHRPIYQRARARGHTKREARRILKRHLSDVIHRRMMRDLANATPHDLT